ncbi:hypothetical protein [Salipiger mucosus]|uniref:Lipoprotein n=1 Tax=Salipiger mucosus DSM 16094 TaxID=1123237 RepID=S9RPW4_9RHOB|nr:hypothetical protein [Salipiger mucosus]EPX76049.1 hypothetical protein Salmuc_00702 [Salipiger mucosus DSM 16094]
MRAATFAAALGLGLVALAGCDTAVPRVATAGASAPDTRTSEAARSAQIAEVTRALMALGPGVDPAEAARAAEIAVREPLDWAREWQVVDPPFLHNVKVVHGLREKGVCQDFADALEIALHAEGFGTLELHRAIANARNPKLEHATVIVTAPGQAMQEGLILDPWRIGQGRLWVGRVTEDPRYSWESRASVRAWHKAWKARAGVDG